LPEPVSAAITTSFPARNTGAACDCTYVAVSNPRRLSDASTAGCASSRLANGTASGSGASAEAPSAATRAAAAAEKARRGSKARPGDANAVLTRVASRVDVLGAGANRDARCWGARTAATRVNARLTAIAPIACTPPPTGARRRNSTRGARGDEVGCATGALESIKEVTGDLEGGTSGTRSRCERRPLRPLVGGAPRATTTAADADQ